jgi:phenylacetate-CoA ligase
VADWKLKLYHRLPLPARALMASARGWQLQGWRYGRETERLVAEAFERESWSQDRWRQWQEERLAFVLHRAATRVPYYREQWAARRRAGDQASWELLENWPVLEKGPLRQHGRAFVADDCDVRQMFHDHTSGTSGKSLDLWYRRQTVREWYALFEARWRRWYGVTMRDRWGILGGQLVTPVGQRRPPFWVWNAGMRQLYLSSYHLAPDLIPAYLDAIAEYNLTYLLGYTSSLHAVAQVALKLKRGDIRLKVVLTNAEPVFDYQRTAIQEAFQCPLRETYGMAETVAAASECEAGRLHLWPEAGWLEVFNQSQAASAGEAGDLICTSLLNADMPLIRYRVGDRAALADPQLRCSCGRRLPQIASLEGRIDDVLYTVDGRRIGRLDPIFKSQLPVQEAQIVQERLDRVRVRYVPDEGFDDEAARSITERLQDRMGAVEVTLEAVSEIPRTSSGKFRAVVCQLPPEQLAELRGSAV